ncbi:hypothetical protein NMG60_11003472 [Bertholletia excelsa]
MESTDSSAGSPQLPPGFRFHPTDEELVVHYLKRKAAAAPLPVAIIADVDLYKFDPWELPAKATFGEQEWYFFSPRDRKYPNGARPNRAATSGYWKATGTDKPVMSATGNQKVGVKKALVFYGGKPPKGIKTNWIMHEYRLTDSKPSSSKPPQVCDPLHKKASLRLDDWVLCRIYKKNNPPRSMDHEREDFPITNLLATMPPAQPKPAAAAAAASCAAFLGNDHNVNFLEGIMATDALAHLAAPSASKPQLPLKRSLPSLYWDDDAGASAGETGSSSSSSKRFHDCVAGSENASIAALLGHLPQTPELHHQAGIGISSDGVFRQPYQLPSLNWFS